jgi:hypothetical protein
MGKRKEVKELKADSKLSSIRKSETERLDAKPKQKKQRRDSANDSQHNCEKRLNVKNDPNFVKDESIITEMDAMVDCEDKQNDELQSKSDFASQKKHASTKSNQMHITKLSGVTKTPLSEKLQGDKSSVSESPCAAAAAAGVATTVDFRIANASGDNSTQILQKLVQTNQACTMPETRLSTDSCSVDADSLNALQRIRSLMIMEDLNTYQLLQDNHQLHHPSTLMQHRDIKAGTSMFSTAESVHDRQALMQLVEQKVTEPHLATGHGTIQPSVASLLGLENNAQALSNQAGIMNYMDIALEAKLLHHRLQQQLGQGLNTRVAERRDNLQASMAHWPLSELCSHNIEQKLSIDRLSNLAQLQVQMNRYGSQPSGARLPRMFSSLLQPLPLPPQLNLLNSVAAMQYSSNPSALSMNQTFKQSPPMFTNSPYLHLLASRGAKNNADGHSKLASVSTVPTITNKELERMIETNKNNAAAVAADSSNNNTTAGSPVVQSLGPLVTVVNIPFELFPVKLYRLLFDAQQRNQQHIVSFTPSGNAFVVYRPIEFMSDIAPLYFKITSLASFQRQLYIYGFHRTQEGDIRDAYTNPNFKKDRPELLEKIHRGGR